MCIRDRALKHVEESTIAEALDSESESPKEVLRAAVLAVLKKFEDNLRSQKFSELVRVAKNVFVSEIIASAYDIQEDPKAFLIDKIMEGTITQGCRVKFKNSGFDLEDIGNEKKKQHGTGRCKPCKFIHKQYGSMGGAYCHYCHLCDKHDISVANIENVREFRSLAAYEQLLLYKFSALDYRDKCADTHPFCTYDFVRITYDFYWITSRIVHTPEAEDPMNRCTV